MTHFSSELSHSAEYARGFCSSQGKGCRCHFVDVKLGAKFLKDYAMEYSSAEMICVLKVNTQCEACKVKVMQVLQRIRGVYNITIDGEQGTVKVTGRVNPNTLLSVLEKYGKHAEVKYVKFDGEVVERNPGYYYGEHHGYAAPPYGMEQYCSSSYPPLPLPMPCPQHQWYHHYQPSHDYFSQPPPPPPPFWAPPPPPPPRPYGCGPPPLTSFWTPRPPHVDPMGEASRENKQNQCAMM